MLPFSALQALSRLRRVQFWLVATAFGCGSSILAHAATTDEKTSVASAASPASHHILRMATDADGHKFVLTHAGNNNGWTYSIILQVVGDNVFLLNGIHFDKPTGTHVEHASYPLDAFDVDSQKYIKDWVKKHPDNLPGMPPPSPPAAPTGVAHAWPEGFYGLTDTTGVLKGRTITAMGGTAMGGDLALCTDGALVDLGGNSNDPAHLRISPAIVPLADVFKSNKIITLLEDGNHVICADGSLYELVQQAGGTLAHPIPKPGPLLLDGPVKGHQVMAYESFNTAILYADGTLAFERKDLDTRGLLDGKKVTAVTHDAILCDDGTLLVRQETDKKKRLYSLFVVKMEGVLAGKKITAIAEPFFDNYSHLLVLCSDGTLVGWGRYITRPTLDELTHPTGVTSTISPKETAISPEDIQVYHLTPKAPPPHIISGLGALKGKMVTAIAASGSLIQCSDGTVAYWNGDGPPKRPDYGGLLKDKTILAVYCGGRITDEPTVLFQEPGAASIPTSTSTSAESVAIPTATP